MATYELSLIPIDQLSVFLNGVASTPWTSASHATDGGLWNWNSPYTISYSAEDVVTITISDSDSDPDHLNDDTWWREGKTLQTIQTAVGYASAGDAIADEYEVQFTAVVDGVVKTYTLVAVTAFKTADGYPNAVNFIGFTFDGEWPPADVVLTYVPNSNADNETLNIAEQTLAPVPCFVTGTMILTQFGPMKVEDLVAGMPVWTRDHGMQPIRWIGSKRMSNMALQENEKMKPICIRANALGENIPAADLFVSPQHRMLLRSRIAQRMFGTDQILVAAKQLLQLDGIEVVQDAAEVEYFHILFDRHEIVLANGAESESLFIGPEAIRAVGAAARAEILAIFPELENTDYRPEAARDIISGRQARKLATRHMQHGRAVVS